MRATISAWQLGPDDRLEDGRVVKYDPTYTDPFRTHVHVDFMDGTYDTYLKDQDITILNAIG